MLSESVPHTMLSPSWNVPQTMLSATVRSVPQTMLSTVSEIVPQTMLSASLERAPDDVVAVAVASRPPHRSELERVRLRPDQAASQTVAAPVDLLAPFPAEVQPIARLGGLEELASLHGPFGVQEPGALRERVVAICSAAP